MIITKDSKTIDLKVQISKLEIINFSKETKILICREEIIIFNKIEDIIILMAIDSQKLKMLLMMTFNKQMIIGGIIKVKMVGMMKVEIKVNRVNVFLKVMKINFKNKMVMNGIKILKNKIAFKIVFKKLVRNKIYKNLWMMFNISMICGDHLLRN
jgi:hypothetical protein